MMNSNNNIDNKAAAEIKISVRNVYKIFGGHTDKCFSLLANGKTKDQILKATSSNIALTDISLDIMSGEIFVIMGLSGSGKSTLIRHFNRLIDPTKGEIIISGTDIIKLNPAELRTLRQNKISMVFQSFGLLPHWTIIDNAAFALFARGVKRPEARMAAYEWLKRVGLANYAKSYPDQLSGGMKQRVGLALTADTDIILMDEPFSALDPLIRSNLQEQLLELQNLYKKTIVFVTHDIDEAFRIGSQIAILRDGRLVQLDTPKNIKNDPIDDYVRRFTEKSHF